MIYFLFLINLIVDACLISASLKGESYIGILNIPLYYNYMLELDHERLLKMYRNFRFTSAGQLTFLRSTTWRL